jgi:hypothetical protein
LASGKILIVNLGKNVWRVLLVQRSIKVNLLAAVITLSKVRTVLLNVVRTKTLV